MAQPNASVHARKGSLQSHESSVPLTAGLQKVSAQLELNKPAPQTVVNNQ